MAEPKTKVNDGDVMAFLNATDEKRRTDGLALLESFKKITCATSYMHMKDMNGGSSAEAL